MKSAKTGTSMGGTLINTRSKNPYEYKPSKPQSKTNKKKSIDKKIKYKKKSK